MRDAKAVRDHQARARVATRSSLRDRPAKRQRDRNRIIMSGRRLLSVTVLEARNVLGIESATSSDTYAKIGFLSYALKEIKSESAKTKVVSRTISPRWGDPPGEGESFVFGENYDMSNADTLPTLRVALFDKNTFSADIPMGAFELKLEQVVAAGPDGLDQWFALGKDHRAKMKGHARGDVHVRVRFLDSKATGHEAEADVTPFELEEPDHPDQQPNQLYIRVIEAKDLPVMDARTLLGTGTDSSDPFVRIVVEGEPDKKLKVRALISSLASSSPRVRSVSEPKLGTARARPRPRGRKSRARPRSRRRRSRRSGTRSSASTGSTTTGSSTSWCTTTTRSCRASTTRTTSSARSRSTRTS